MNENHKVNEQARIDWIQKLIDNLIICCKCGTQGGLNSSERKYFLSKLKNIEIGAGFQERIEEAKAILSKGINDTIKALNICEITEKDRAKLVKSDKESILKISNDLDAFISGMTFPEMKTEEASKYVLYMVENIKSTIEAFEKAGQDLI